MFIQGQSFRIDALGELNQLVFQLVLWNTHLYFYSPLESTMRVGHRTAHHLGKVISVPLDPRFFVEAISGHFPAGNLGCSKETGEVFYRLSPEGLPIDRPLSASETTGSRSRDITVTYKNLEYRKDRVFPREIRIESPSDGFLMTWTIHDILFDEPSDSSIFRLSIPPGTKIQRLDES
jgi:hypothetical protein